MRKASKILFLIGGIVSIVCAIYWLVFGIICTVIPNLPEFYDAFIESWNKNPQPGVTADEAYAAFKGVMIALGVLLYITVACAGVNSFFSFKAFNDTRKNGKPTTAINVLNIVFGVLGGVLVNIVGAIFAFVANGQEDRRAALEKK